jgi:hypothetical protein
VRLRGLRSVVVVGGEVPETREMFLQARQRAAGKWRRIRSALSGYLPGLGPILDKECAF